MPILRPTYEEDLPELGELLDSIFRRPRGVVDQCMLTDFPLVFAPSNLGNCRVLVEEGRIVSHAGLWRRELVIDGERLTVGIVVSVATHPEYRGRGYAAQTVSALQNIMHAEGYDLGLLWTAVPDFYDKLGWELAVPRGMLVALPSAPFVAGGNSEIARFDPARHLDGVMALHECEAIRFVRRPDEYQTLLTLPKIETWVAAQDGKVVAYLVHGTGCNKRGIIEYGGPMNCLAALASHVAGRQPAGGELPLLAYHVRPDLLEWAQQIGFPLTPLQSSKGLGHEMIYAVPPDRISPHVRVQLFTWGLEHA